MRWILGAALTPTLALSLALPATLLFSGEAESSVEAEERTCEITVEVRDSLDFNPRNMTVDSGCESFTLTLKHVGTMPASTMGHNWVLSRTEDFDGAVMDGQRAGFENHFVRPGDERVLAATIIIGGGEETTISFDPSILEPGGDYTFFCSFPAHFVLMQGKLTVL